MDGRNPHLLIARIASAVIALGSIQAIALGNSVDLESQIVVLRPVDAHVSTSGSWISIFVFAGLCLLGVALWWRARFGFRFAGGAGFISKLFFTAHAQRAVGNGAIEILDRTAMAKGQALALVRVGDRVVLLGQSAQGFQRLAEFAVDSPQAIHGMSEQSPRNDCASDLLGRVG